MKICRYEEVSGGPVRIGLVDNDGVRDVSAVAAMLPSLRWPLPRGDLFISHLEELRPRIAELARTAKPVPVGSVRSAGEIGGALGPPLMVALHRRWLGRDDGNLLSRWCVVSAARATRNVRCHGRS